jgi:hypothetical protein
MVLQEKKRRSLKMTKKEFLKKYNTLKGLEEKVCEKWRYDIVSWDFYKEYKVTIETLKRRLIEKYNIEHYTSAILPYYSSFNRGGDIIRVSFYMLADFKYDRVLFLDDDMSITKSMNGKVVLW